MLLRLGQQALSQAVQIEACVRTQKDAWHRQIVQHVNVLQQARLLAGFQGIHFVVNQQLRHIGGPDVGQDRLHLCDLLGMTRMGRVHHVQRQLDAPEAVGQRVVDLHDQRGTTAVEAQKASSPSSTAKEDQPVQLEAFEVVMTQDKGYHSPYSGSALRTNEEIMKVPQSITVLTRDLIERAHTA